MQYDLLITNGHIVTPDLVLGELSGADIVVRNRVITDIGQDLSGRPPHGRVIDACDRLVLPGLVGCPPACLAGIIEQFRSTEQRGRLRMGRALRGRPSAVPR